MYPYILIDSLGVELPTYGICAMAGALVAFLVSLVRRKRTILSEDNLLDGFIFAILFGMLGAKLLYLIKDPPIFPLTWDDIKELLTTGLVFYGGLIGGLGGLALAAKKTKKPFLTFTDVIAPAFCFAHGFGRVGCLLAGCCYGVEMEGLFCIELGGTSRLAVQLLEALFLFLLGGGLCLISRKKLRRGTVTGLYLLLYAVWRFTIEFWRDDDRGFVGALSTSQFIALFAFAAGILLLFLAKKYGWPSDRTDPEHAEPPVVETEVNGMPALIALAEKMTEEERAEALAEKSKAILPALAKHTGDEKKAGELYCTFVLGALLADNRLADEEYPLLKPMLKDGEADIEACRAALRAAEDKTAYLKENNSLLLACLGEDDPALRQDCALMTLLLCGADKKVTPEEEEYIGQLLS